MAKRLTPLQRAAREKLAEARRESGRLYHKKVEKLDLARVSLKFLPDFDKFLRENLTKEELVEFYSSTYYFYADTFSALWLIMPFIMKIVIPMRDLMIDAGWQLTKTTDDAKEIYYHFELDRLHFALNFEAQRPGSTCKLVPISTKTSFTEITVYERVCPDGANESEELWSKKSS